MRSLGAACAVAVCCGIVGAPASADESIRKVTISSTPAKAAIFSVVRGKGELLGYTPAVLSLEFPDPEHTHDLILVRMGYELARETIRGDTQERRIALVRREMLAPADPGTEAVHNQVARLLQQRIDDNSLATRHNVTGRVRVLRVQDTYVLSFEVLLFEDEVLRKLRRLSRSGRSQASQTELAREVFEYSKELLRSLSLSLIEVPAIGLIDVTVNFPLPQVELRFTREEIPEYYYHRTETTAGRVTTTVTVSGWTYSVRDTTDINLRERTDGLKFIVPVSKLRMPGEVSLDALKSDMLVFAKERSDKAFVRIQFAD